MVLEKYKNLLKYYLATKDEGALYRADQFSKRSLQQDISPDEIVQIHIDALQDLYPDLPEEMRLSLHFLLETMISYGIAHQEFRALREKQFELKSEIEVAANMQNTLLNTVIPDDGALDIGAISVAAHQMNGDYYHFINDQKNIGVAIADVIGKGIPAALCMSMIKYALDTFPANLSNPQTILQLLNRVVERNVEPGMFITMFYGYYNQEDHLFHYSSAGHEPGLFYHALSNTFEKIEAKGIVLGVQKDVTYQQYSKYLSIGDMVILFTDGVTECRRGDQFIQKEEIVDVIKEYIHLSAQEMVDQVYRYFERLQDFDLRDDFTLIILRRKY
ncbi:sigma-B regulation protein RsbU (phosphoserine phosphatase) [Salinibacillus kushneri]|uniref:Sigma-B regulation protein RsbU (Phosphoserine phosphatase) n=1 Tax=Salinibacillus kushneri TaxID=237682 RepID=A0A1I0BJ01_9BACI|nr:PP2C family protein-serine/threonine phosphatase [Salinibacillus kushneri]SET06605.1 sigma-B regulation protein RsbU (phosphoserine phosphatase) [Salinibacillus kushneri]